MIVSFGDRATEDLYHGRKTRKARSYPNEILRNALIKLDLINSAVDIKDLRVPPGNRLEALKGDLAGYHSVRINLQWRVIFRWIESDAHDVQIVDYHA